MKRAKVPAQPNSNVASAAAAVIASFITLPSSAQTFMGAGASRCDLFQNIADPSYEAARNGMDQWALGYVSGLNMIWVQLNKRDALAPIQTDAILRGVREYCRANPSKNITNAANDVWLKLVGK